MQTRIIVGKLLLKLVVRRHVSGHSIEASPSYGDRTKYVKGIIAMIIHA